MSIYLLWQENYDYDTYDAMIVAAENEEEARKIHPDGRWPTVKSNWDSWVESPNKASVKLIGIAEAGVTTGIILLSYNAS